MNPQPDPPAGAANTKAKLPPIVARLFREPLTHFLLIGAVIFLGSTAMKAAERPVLRIDSAELEQLAAYWEMQMQRPPNKGELAGLIQDRIDEEILAREAVRLGLDRDDMIIRRRLAQKMAFASDDTTIEKEPDEAALKAFYDKTKNDYLTPARMALRHLYFSDDRQGMEAKQAAQQALWAMRDHDDHQVLSDPFVLPLSYADIGADQLARDFGPAFAESARMAAVGTWFGPVRSEYGWHALLIQTRHPAAARPFDTVQGEVREVYLADRRRAGNAARMDSLREKYRIQVAAAPR